MTLTVLKPGLLTTVQDRGRHGHRALGVGCSGAADAFSARAANLLAGNDPDAALLEITLAGPTLRFGRAARVALCGAECELSLDAEARRPWGAFDVRADGVVAIGACRRGARAYLAIAGGIAVEAVLGSRSTDLRAGFGGWQGRSLRTGDVLPLGPAPGCRSGARRAWIDPTPTLDLARDAVVHVLPGRDALAQPELLWSSTWRVAPASDRQGLRLDGPALALESPREMISEPLVPGTIQLPPQGGPIVLLADAQTVGGYPVIGIVASADLPRLAQCRPGDVVHLRATGLDGARAQARALDAHLARIAIALRG